VQFSFKKIFFYPNPIRIRDGILLNLNSIWLSISGWKVDNNWKKRNIIISWFVTRYYSFCFIIKFLNIILKKKNNLEIFLYLFWSDMIWNVTIFNVYLAEAWRAESPDPLQAWDVWWLLLTLQEHHQELNRRVWDRTKDQHQVYPESLYKGSVNKRTLICSATIYTSGEYGNSQFV